MSEPEKDGYALVMPFVAVATNGGQYEDEPYVCGYEMGLLDGCLSMKPSKYEATIHVGNRAQADLIAMKRGYTVTFSEPYQEDEDHIGEWLFANFREVRDDRA